MLGVLHRLTQLWRGAACQSALHVSPALTTDLVCAAVSEHSEPLPPTFAARHRLATLAASFQTSGDRAMAAAAQRAVDAAGDALPDVRQPGLACPVYNLQRTRLLYGRGASGVLSYVTSLTAAHRGAWTLIACTSPQQARQTPTKLRRRSRWMTAKILCSRRRLVLWTLSRQVLSRAG